MEKEPSDEIKIPDKYPQKIRDILKGINAIEEPEGKLIRTAYRLADILHKGQTRKGIDKPAYITHPLIVYDLVKRSIGDKEVPNKDVTLAATLVHDVIEDHRYRETKIYKKLLAEGMRPEKIASKIGGFKPEIARFEALIILMGSFYDSKSPYDEKRGEFVDALLALTGELTNPVKYTDKDHNDITKEQWQVEKIKTVSMQAKLIKICDQTANIMSNIEEVPPWKYKQLTDYIDKTKAIVKAVNDSKKDKEAFYDAKSPYAPAIEHAMERFYLVCRESQKILDNRVARGDPIPAKKPIASFALNVIDEMMRKDKEKNPGR